MTPPPAREPAGPGAASKAAFTELARAQLRAFLDSGARLGFTRSAEPEVTVLLVLYNRAELTLRCLRTLREEPGCSLEVILVDNASRDATPLLLSRLDGVRTIRNHENRGFLLAVNQAARRARGRQLLLLNNDVELLPGALAAALGQLAGPGVGAVGGRLILLDGSLQEAGSIVWSDGSALGYGRGDRPDASPYMFTRDVDYCSGAFLLTPRRLFLELGGLDERYRPAYYEEVDYCFRLQERGLRVVYEPRAAMTHFEFASSESGQDAVQMQLERRAVFVAAHSRRLARQLPPAPENVLRARQRPGRGRRVLLIDDRVPHEALGAGFPRARRMVVALVRAGHQVTLYPTSGQQEPWSEVYRSVPPNVEVVQGPDRPSLGELLRQRRDLHEVVVVSRPHNMAALQSLRSGDDDPLQGAALVYDAEAVFALREVTRRQVLGEPWPEAIARRLVDEELQLAQDADAVLCVSEKERSLFAAATEASVVVVGHAVDPRPTARPFAGRSGLLFLGAAHAPGDPNADALAWFVGQVLPRVRELVGGEVPLRVAGRLPAAFARPAAPGVDWLGPVDDAEALFDEARAFVAPTRFGAGISLKVVEAAARGLPCVATPLLAEQLGWRPGHELLTGEGAEAFARQCALLLGDEATWTSVRQAALQRVQAEAAPELFAERLQQALEGALARHAGRRRPAR